MPHKPKFHDRGSRNGIKEKGKLHGTSYGDRNLGQPVRDPDYERSAYDYCRRARTDRNGSRAESIRLPVIGAWSMHVHHHVHVRTRFFTLGQMPEYRHTVLVYSCILNLVYSCILNLTRVLNLVYSCILNLVTHD